MLVSDEAESKVPVEVPDAGLPGSTQSPEQQKALKRTISQEQSQSCKKAAVWTVSC